MNNICLLGNYKNSALNIKFKGSQKVITNEIAEDGNNSNKRLENALRSFFECIRVKKEILTERAYSVEFLDKTSGKAAIYELENNKWTVATAHLNQDGIVDGKQEVVSFSVKIPSEEEIKSFTISDGTLGNFLFNVKSGIVNELNTRIPSKEEVCSILETLTRSLKLVGPIVSNQKGTFLIA